MENRKANNDSQRNCREGMRHSSSFLRGNGQRPDLGTQHASQGAPMVGETQSMAQKSGFVIRESAHAKSGKQSESSIEQADDCTREICGHGVAGNGELRDDPSPTRHNMGKDTVEELLQLAREKAVEEEVRNDQVVASRGVSFQGVGVVQANSLGDLLAAPANAAVENAQHGMAG